VSAGTAPDGEEFVLLGIPDVNGVMRGKALRRPAFDAALRDGTTVTDLLLALDPSDVPISDYEGFGIRSGAADLIVRPEADTLRELSWQPGWSICLGTPSWPDGRRCELASREVLGASLARLQELGYTALAAFEYELRVRDGSGAPLTSAISYSLDGALRFEQFVSRLAPALDRLDVELSAVHTEAGPGLLELNVGARAGMRAADDAAYLKFAVKAVAASLDLRASFLAKTSAGEEGSSGHVHLSLWRGDENAFAPRGGVEPPALLAAAVAGILEHMPGGSLLLNPTINSYKRLVPGFFAPVNASWGVENRSAAVRVILSEQAQRCRLECRRSGADANPYLALASLVVSAADGIARDVAPPPPVVGDASTSAELPELPGSLEAALAAFDRDEELRRGLGEEFSRYFAVSRAWELKAWREAVSDWERTRYEAVV
jgi:glutamine synthetase